MGSGTKGKQTLLSLSQAELHPLLFFRTITYANWNACTKERLVSDPLAEGLNEPHYRREFFIKIDMT